MQKSDWACDLLRRGLTSVGVELAQEYILKEYECQIMIDKIKKEFLAGGGATVEWEAAVDMLRRTFRVSGIGNSLILTEIK